MLDKHDGKTYPTEASAAIVAEKLNRERTSDEVECGRYVALPNHLHGGWIIAPVYY